VDIVVILTMILLPVLMVKMALLSTTLVMVEAAEQAQSFLKERTLADYYEEILMGALTLAWADAQRGRLDEQQAQRVRDTVSEIVEDLEVHKDSKNARSAPEEEGALNKLEQLEKAAPPPPPKVDPGVAAYNEGVELIQKGDKDGAEKKFDEAVAAKPDLAQAWKVISQLAYERKDYAKALSSGRKLLELDAKDGDLYGILMDSASKTGDNAAALDYKKKFVAANADNPEVNYNAGVESYTAGDYNGATASFAKAVQLKPDMANAYFWMGMSEYNQKSYGASRRDFQKYLELAPQGDQADNAKKMLEALPAK